MESKKALIPLVLGLVAYVAMQSGHFLLAGVAYALLGLHTVVTAKPLWLKALGLVSAVFGAWLVAQALGLLALGLLSVLTRQFAIALGGGLILGGLLLLKSLRPARGTPELHLTIAAILIGAILVAYGLGYIG